MSFHSSDGVAGVPDDLCQDSPERLGILVYINVYIYTNCKMTETNVPARLVGE